MISWFYCVEVYKNGDFMGKKSGVYPEFPDPMLTELSGSNNPRDAYRSIINLHQMFDPEIFVVVTAFNQI
ncbi:hypothetical protein F018LOC_01663 [Pectobacterium versatile]|uniref:hypothetical protein n=1 Tax=Pectobacterium versatile TaxID=2488639 RepID=UPI000CDEB65A|nr:hypothetical protein [Pectobacterium versatile]POY55726.1 hypothetical protein F018LOC_01663 [Pectobacterium versatile]